MARSRGRLFFHVIEEQMREDTARTGGRVRIDSSKARDIGEGVKEYGL
jgi:hypothetical protein